MVPCLRPKRRVALTIVPDIRSPDFTTTLKRSPVAASRSKSELTRTSASEPATKLNTAVGMPLF